MNEFLSFSVIGIVAGSIYAITATGLVVTYTTTGIFNFSHGAIGMIAAFSFYQTWQAWHWPVLLALLAVLFVETPILAIGVERALMRRLNRASPEQSLMVTLGLLVILVGAATALWNPTTQRIVPAFFNNSQVGVLGVNVSYQQLLTIAVAIVAIVLLRYFFKLTRIGIAMRAVVDDPELLAMAGAKPFRIAQTGWILGFFLAALAGILLAPTVGSTGLNIETLTLLVVNGYAAAVVGRLKNLPMTFVGAMLLGLMGAYAIAYLPGHIPSNFVAVIPSVIPVAFLFIVLLILPEARLVAAGWISARSPQRVPTLARSVTGAFFFVVVAALGSQLLGGLAVSTLSTAIALGVVALSLVLLTGYAGQISLCQLTFMGVGAFTMGKVAGGGSWFGLLLAVAVAGALGALVAIPVLRLKGLYLALATLAFGEAAYYAFFTNAAVFPGYGGAVSVGRLGFPGMPTVGNRSELVVIAIVFASSALLVLSIRRSRFGKRAIAMNDSPAAFATLGLSVNWTRVAVFSISAALAGLGGVFYGGAQGEISGNDVVFFSSLTLLLFLAVWGLRTISGALFAGLTAASLPVASSHLPQALTDLTGLAAGAGIVLLGRNADGIFGYHWRVPFAKNSVEPLSGDESELLDVP